jgi:hypothetical protein
VRHWAQHRAFVPKNGQALRVLPDHRVRRWDEAQMVCRPGRSVDASAAQDVGRWGARPLEQFLESDRDFLLWASGAERGRWVVLREPSRWPKDGPSRDVAVEPAKELLAGAERQSAGQELALVAELRESPV